VADESESLKDIPISKSPPTNANLSMTYQPSETDPRFCSGATARPEKTDDRPMTPIAPRILPGLSSRADKAMFSRRSFCPASAGSDGEWATQRLIIPSPPLPQRPLAAIFNRAPDFAASEESDTVEPSGGEGGGGGCRRCRRFREVGQGSLLLPDARARARARPRAQRLPWQDEN